MNEPKGFVPRKEDYAERDRNLKERLREDTLKYGTSNPDCIRFRKIHLLRQEHGDEFTTEMFEFWFNHHESCKSCMVWLAQKGDNSLNINDSSKKFEELKGYEDAFKTENPTSNMGENRAGWIKICPYCGQVLDKNGQCPNRCCGF